MLHKKRCRRLFFLFSLCFLFSLTIYSQKLIKNKDYFVSYQHDSGTEEYTKNAYLMFEDGKHKNYIKEDVNSSTLDQNYVGIWNENKNLKEVHNLVLAGHNIFSVFHYLHQVDIGQKFYVFYKFDRLKYQVIEKKIIQIDDFQDLIETEDFRLTLLTCTGNPNTRLLVIAKRL